MNINLNDSFPNYWKRLTKFIVSTCVFMCSTTLFSSSPKEMFPLKEEIKITSDQAMIVIQVFDFIQFTAVSCPCYCRKPCDYSK